jgi:hypothetical protein
MKKETATEWLFKQLWEEPKDKFTWNAILDKAKEMEKEQIKKSFLEGAEIGEMFNNENRAFITYAEQYYNQTFKKD